MIVTALETDAREIVFGGLLGADPVETTELRNSVAMELNATVVTLKIDVDVQSYCLNTIGLSNFICLVEKFKTPKKKSCLAMKLSSVL